METIWNKKDFDFLWKKWEASYKKFDVSLRSVLGSNNNPFIWHQAYHSLTTQTNIILDVSINVLKMDFYPNFSILKVKMLWVPTILKIKDCLSFYKPTIFKNTKQVKYQYVGTTMHTKLKTKVNELMI